MEVPRPVPLVTPQTLGSWWCRAFTTQEVEGSRVLCWSQAGLYLGWGYYIFLPPLAALTSCIFILVQVFGCYLIQIIGRFCSSQFFWFWKPYYNVIGVLVINCKLHSSAHFVLQSNACNVVWCNCVSHPCHPSKETKDNRNAIIKKLLKAKCIQL